MKILLSGASGLIGNALIPSLRDQGYSVSQLVRDPDAAKKPGHLYWNPQQQIIDLNQLEGYDAFIHLSGENIASGRWTRRRKQKIVESRLKTTRFLVQSMQQLKDPPGIFICASATGIYGNRPNETLTEESSHGTDFLADTCQQWEQTALTYQTPDNRVVLLRFGVVLSKAGGFLKKVLPVFRWGLGGKLGNGNQDISWISIDDVVGAIQHILESPGIQGPVNMVSPEPVSNHTLTKTLGSVLKRPTIFPVPAFILRLLFGEMADSILLASTRAQPAVLTQSGYTFKQPALRDALQHN